MPLMILCAIAIINFTFSVFTFDLPKMRETDNHDPLGEGFIKKYLSRQLSDILLTLRIC